MTRKYNVGDMFTTPVQFDSEGKPILYEWDSDKWFNSLPPHTQRNITRQRKVWDIAYGMYRTIPWMRWPILRYIFSFWHSILEDGIVGTCKPRWGAVTFGWLNDGVKPTLWHTWRQLTHDQTDNYTGIYPSGAPKNRKQADEWKSKWEKDTNE